MENVVYLVVEIWEIDSGESGVLTSVFSSMENAKSYFRELKENYTVDYDEAIRDDKCIENDSDTDIEVTFEDHDYYHIYIEEKIIDTYIQKK